MSLAIDSLGQNIIPAFGLAGAAIATTLGMIISIVILVTFLLSTSINHTYKFLANYKFNWEIFKKCLKLGIPSSIGQSLETLTWLYISYLFAMYSKLHSQVFSLSIFFLRDCCCFGIKN